MFSIYLCVGMVGQMKMALFVLIFVSTNGVEQIKTPRFIDHVTVLFGRCMRMNVMYK